MDSVDARCIAVRHRHGSSEKHGRSPFSLCSSLSFAYADRVSQHNIHLVPHCLSHLPPWPHIRHVTTILSFRPTWQPRRCYDSTTRRIGSLPASLHHVAATSCHLKLPRAFSILVLPLDRLGRHSIAQLSSSAVELIAGQASVDPSLSRFLCTWGTPPHPSTSAAKSALCWCVLAMWHPSQTLDLNLTLSHTRVDLVHYEPSHLLVVPTMSDHIM